MKSICWIISILGAFLVLSTLDTQPDPPAVNPTTLVIKIVQAHDCDCDTIAGQHHSPPATYLFPVSLAASDSSKPSRPSDRIVLTGQASDPSPPSPSA